MQNHLAKCIKFPQHSQQATSDKSTSTSIRGETYESDTLSIATAHGPPGIRSLTQCTDECLARAVYTPLQPDILYLLICWMQSSTEFK